MESLKKCNIIDCHENFTNFLAMTKSKPPRHCEAKPKQSITQNLAFDNSTSV
ncbi:hypothetical protein [Helicobacter rodentium]|nr:hypothetical protein [Helicobacter rodentium]